MATGHLVRAHERSHSLTVKKFKVGDPTTWPIFEVHWDDARTATGWESWEGKSHAPESVRSVGLCPKRDDTGITLVLCAGNDEDDDTQINGRVFIPAGMVTKVRRVG